MRSEVGSRVVVVGSANVDLFARVPAIPAPGETVLASGHQTRAGGKGLNQAVAAVRAGAETILVAAVGTDEGGDLLLAEAHAAGIDTSLVRRLDARSGTAWIIVQDDGENAIVVDSGANAALRELGPEDSRAISAAGVVVAQLETPMEVVVAAARTAREGGARMVLNAAPARTLPSGLLADLAVLVVNEHEARQLSGLEDPRGAATALCLSTAAVVVTLGAEGALVAEGRSVRHVPGVPARVVDTTGAGDTFTGVLAAGLAAGLTLDAATGRAVVAGSLAVESAGAVPSIPTADLIDRRVAAAADPTEDLHS